MVRILLPLWGRAGWGLLVAEDDPAARQVVGREVHPDTVTDQDADVELPHLARGIGEDGLAGLEPDLEHGVRQRLNHLGVHLDGLFLAGWGLLGFERVDARAKRGRTAALLRVATFLTQIVAILPELRVRQSCRCRSRPNWQATCGRLSSAKGSRAKPTRPS